MKKIPSILIFLTGLSLSAQLVVTTVDSNGNIVTSKLSDGTATTTNYTTLAAIPNPSTGDSVYVTGDVINPDIAGNFVYHAALSDTNNFGTIISGWAREYEGPVIVEWFGAVGNDARYDADAFINAITFLNSLGGGTLSLTADMNYIIDKEIILYSDITVLGNGAEMSVALPTWDVSPPVFFTIFSNLSITARPMSRTQFGTGIIGTYNIHIKDITFNLNRDGYTLARGVMLSSDFNAVRFVDAQNCTVENCTFLDSQISTNWITTAVVNFEKSVNCILKDSNFDRCTGISISEGDGCIAEGNTFHNSPATSVEIYTGIHHQIINNTTNKQWWKASSIGTSGDYSIVRNNTINQSNLTGITIGHSGLFEYGAHYSVIEDNVIFGGPVGEETGKIGILSQNGIGLRIKNNRIFNLFKSSDWTNLEAAILVSGAADASEQYTHEDLIVEGNIIKGATAGIQIRDQIHAELRSNHIDHVYLGIYGESNAANSPNSKLIIDKNIIKDSDIAMYLNAPTNIITKNTIESVDTFGYLYYGHYVFNDNIIREALIGPHSFEALSFTMRDNYFYNTVPIGDTLTGSLITLRAPKMDLKDLTIDGTIIDFPTGGTPTTWVMRAFALSSLTGSQYYRSTQRIND